MSSSPKKRNPRFAIPCKWNPMNTGINIFSSDFPVTVLKCIGQSLYIYIYNVHTESVSYLKEIFNDIFSDFFVLNTLWRNVLSNLWIMI